MKKTIFHNLALVLATVALAPAGITFGSEGMRPIADAGSSRYAAQDPIVLDGTASYDPDDSGLLSYMWRQIAGPSVTITDADTATPTISGFIQTDAVQECEFELVVSDGELTSLPDTVKVIIVPYFGDYELELKNDSFDPDKPTIVYFGGGYGGVGGLANTWSPFRTTPSNRNAPMDPNWLTRANIIEFPKGWWPDNSTGAQTYYRCGDVIIVHLSSFAPNYNQAIQIVGHSAGSSPTMDAALHLNEIYQDPRYNVNRVTYLDCGRRGQPVEYALVEKFVASSVDGEQCWFDSIESGETWFWPNALIVYATFGHGDFKYWYGGSLTNPETNTFNNGVVGGAYWSVAGPGKNLQLAPTPGETIYRFRWHGSMTSGRMDFQDESSYPGSMPEPVTLLAWRDSLDSKGVVLTCKESENAVGYELLLGHDPYRIVDYNIVSDTAIPPTEVIKTFPFEEIWWTIRARDKYGSTIYADPIRIDLENLPWPTIENLTNGQTYGFIQAAIDHAAPGDEIVIGPGTYQENIDLEGENLTVTSTDPNDPTVVAATIINGVGQRPVVTLSRGQGAGCVLAGLTITGGTVGIACGDASPTIRNCTIESTGTNSIEFLYGYEPIIIDCIILGPIREVYDPSLVALWKMDETDGSIAYDSIGVNDGICHGEPLWQPAGGKLAGALEFDGIDDYISVDFVLSPDDGAFSVFAWIKDGSPGQVILSQGIGVNWLMADLVDGVLKTDLKEPATTGRGAPPAGPPLISTTVVTDSYWHRVGFVRDGSDRILYVDDIEVARDTATNLEFAGGGLHIGTGKALEAGTYWSGLIDDVRIYNRAVTP